MKAKDILELPDRPDQGYFCNDTTHALEKLWAHLGRVEDFAHTTHGVTYRIPGLPRSYIGPFNNLNQAMRHAIKSNPKYKPNEEITLYS
jgi:hypothetical protein